MGCCGAKNSVEVKNPEKKEKEEEKKEEEKEEEMHEQVSIALKNENQEKEDDEQAKEEEPEEQYDDNNMGEEGGEEEYQDEEIQEDIDFNPNENDDYILKSKGNENENSNIIKTKQKLGKNKPFIISEIEKSPNKRVKLIVNASAFVEEYMMPIWCPKDVYLKFTVKGKWRINKLSEYTDSRGLLSTHYGGYNYGALIGKIGFGDSFVVADKGTILVKKEGPLFLRQNLPRKMKIAPEGKLEVEVYDGEFMEIKDINNKIEWKEQGTIEQVLEDENNNKNNNNKSNKNKNMKENKEFEKKIRTHFNNLRTNMSLYYEKYISFNPSLKTLKKILDEINKKLKSPLSSLTENENYNKFLDEYINSLNPKEIMKNVNNSRLIDYLPKLEENIEYYLSDQFGTPVKVKSIVTKKSIPNEIIIQYLLDKKYRPYIFNEKSQSLAVKAFKNIFNDSSLIFVAISLQKDEEKKDFS